MDILGWRKRFGIALAEAKRRDGLTQEKLATRLRTSQSSVAHWKNGQKTPRVDDFPRIANALGVSTAWLLLGMEVESDEEVRLLREYRLLEPEKQATLLAIMRALLVPVDREPPTAEEAELLRQLENQHQNVSNKA